MNNRPLPADIVERFGHLPDAMFRGGDEWSAACPKCGTGRGGRDPSDRFRIWERPGQASNFWCRRCGYMGFADDDKPGHVPDPERIKEAEELRVKLAAQEEARLRAKIAELNHDAYWRGWHDAMTEAQRALWRQQGIPDPVQDMYKLGYTNQYRYRVGEELHQSPAMTIPIFDVGWQAVNVQYRLTNPVEGAGKYRFTAGLPAPLFLADPDQEPEGATLLVEGAKKAIVSYLHLGHKLTVVAVPSKAPGEQLLARLKDCDPVYVALDPDAYQGRDNAAQRVGRLLGDRARFVRLPAKPDDLLVQYGFDANQMMTYVNRATRVC